MKFLIAIVAACTVSAVFAQRPTYAGSRPIGKPELASRFKDTQEESSTVDVANRVGADGTTQKIPVDARGDADLVNRLNQWPRENQPFWLINAEHIEASRHPQPGQSGQGFQGGQSGQGVQAGLSGQGFQTQTRGSFGGNTNQFVRDDDYDNRDDFGGFSFESRSSFDQYDPSVPSRPIRPEQPRSSFLGSRGR